MNYNELNAHRRDPFLDFDPAGHVYTYEGREFKSVTTLVEECFPQFDASEWAPRIALREGVDPQVIMDRWEAEGCRARELGTAMHEKIERYYLGDDCREETDAYRLFRPFAESTRLTPYRTEWRIYDEDHDLAARSTFSNAPPVAPSTSGTGSGRRSSLTATATSAPAAVMAKPDSFRCRTSTTLHTGTMRCS